MPFASLSIRCPTLYRYDYRFGYNLLLDEENSIEKKLHTPVREEWEAEDDEI